MDWILFTVAVLLFLFGMMIGVGIQRMTIHSRVAFFRKTLKTGDPFHELSHVPFYVIGDWLNRMDDKDRQRQMDRDNKEADRMLADRMDKETLRGNEIKDDV